MIIHHRLVICLPTSVKQIVQEQKKKSGVRYCTVVFNVTEIEDMETKIPDKEQKIKN